MSKVKVSIVVPVYNVRQYIERCVLSIINQTCTDIECIFVDDCSPDDSIKIIESLLLGYVGSIHFSIIHHDRNRGLSAARNTGTRKAQGDYVYYLDSDDEITPTCIESLLLVADKYLVADIVQGSTKSIPQPEKLLHDWRNIQSKINYPEFTEDKDWIIYHLYAPCNFIPVNAWNKLIKKSFIDNAGNALYFKEGIIHEDERWIFDVAEQIHAMAFSTQITYIHYLTENSIMTSGSNYKSISAWDQILKDKFNYMHEPFLDMQMVYWISMAAAKYLQIDYSSKEKELVESFHKTIQLMIKKCLKEGRFLMFCCILLVRITPLYCIKGKKWVQRRMRYESLCEFFDCKNPYLKS